VEIDWDRIAGDYHRYVLSPYAPEMTSGGATRRNLLLTELTRTLQRERQGREPQRLRLLDCGCGPGLLFAHLPGWAAPLLELHALDRSPTMLAAARRSAASSGLSLITHQADLAAPATGEHHRACYDLVVCVNALLPPSRAPLPRMLANLAAMLRPDGRLLAILPALVCVYALIKLVSGA